MKGMIPIFLIIKPHSCVQHVPYGIKNHHTCSKPQPKESVSATKCCWLIDNVRDSREISEAFIFSSSFFNFLIERWNCCRTVQFCDNHQMKNRAKRTQWSHLVGVGGGGAKEFLSSSNKADREKQMSHRFCSGCINIHRGEEWMIHSIIFTTTIATATPLVVIIITTAIIRSESGSADSSGGDDSFPNDTNSQLV